MKEIVEDENYWIEAFQKREDRALAHFFDLHYKSLCYFAGRLVQNDAEAEDIVSGCFVKLWKSDREVKTVESIKAFLYIACRNACFDHLRKLKVRTVLQQEYYEQLETSDQTVLVKIIKTEVLDLLEKEIELLPEKCREVFRLFYFEHKKTTEIMASLMLNEKAVRYQKAKAIEMLKISLLKKGLKEGLYLALLLFLDQ
ncbi:RNA polymerase sigma-70 factor (family 1) [Pedobacter africanus]|uniref:RNA polymerase sigma-70 factor (ECF subfamily) n=1 Tax=Pedobacter africanus TaxID=151894 RepID=A0ACC6KWE1_9SPHI|nr:RNA polymerase sigma-70 factor [Pedobacter africanus]MDR6783391.1 RNA polymerase sigma-70 factor (ECF subfamily) [Pedobacter africanus]